MGTARRKGGSVWPDRRWHFARHHRRRERARHEAQHQVHLDQYLAEIGRPDELDEDRSEPRLIESPLSLIP